jgi:hypothetical protein
MSADRDCGSGAPGKSANLKLCELGYANRLRPTPGSVFAVSNDKIQNPFLKCFTFSQSNHCFKQIRLLTATEKTCETSLSRLLRQLTRLPFKRKRIINYISTRDLPMSLKLSQMGLSLFSSTRPQPVQRVLNRDPCSSTTCSEPTTKTIFIAGATRQMIANRNHDFLPTCTFVKLVDILSYHHNPPAHTSLLQKWHVLTG